MSVHIQCRKPIIKLHTSDAGVDGAPSPAGAGLESTFPAGDLMKALFSSVTNRDRDKVRCRGVCPAL